MAYRRKRTYRKKKRTYKPRRKTRYRKRAQKRVGVELKHKNNVAFGDITDGGGPGGAIFTLAVGLNGLGGVDQGVRQTQRVGNRVKQMYNQFKFLFTATDAEASAVRLVVFGVKNAESNPSLMMQDLSLVNFINTQTYNVHKDMRFTVNTGCTKWKSFGFRPRGGKTVEFPDDASTLPVLNDRIFIAAVSATGTTCAFEMQNRIYFADP